MWKWRLTAVGVNLLLGVPAVVPVWLVWYFLANGPFADVGWTRREPTENDGMALWLVIVVPVVLAFGLTWWLANGPVRRRAALDPLVYWPAGVLLTLLPTGALVVASVV
ncbi:hypothetical protein [Streptomyces sp. B1I3]|uniref:hypothetical protein n=1 Tax=Streptomyces sp. B1I3 TaxID=3042264 RepID=UPI00277D6464|nr:hypothetical protein [Streptomyces sp. B1I3]MDQ0795936.1 hypothetical protein [Streptomyces sp. B1I3]